MDARWVLAIPVGLVLQYCFSGSHWKQALQGDIGATFSVAEHAAPTDDIAASPTTTTTTTLESRLRGAFVAALVGDAMCLGSHYEYDAQKIEEAYRGKEIKMLAPGEYLGGKTVTPGWGSGEGQNFHPTKGAGDMTDYGDTALWMLEFLQKQRWHPSFDAAAFAAFLWDKVNRYDGYVNMATKEVIGNYMSGKRGVAAASQHGDLAGATRCAALLFVFQDEEKLAQAARECAQLTHNHEHTIAAAEFILRTAFRILRHHEPLQTAVLNVQGTMKNAVVDYAVEAAKSKLAEVNRDGSAINKQFRQLGAIAKSAVMQNDIAIRTLGAEVREESGRFPLREGEHMGMMGKASPAIGALAASLFLMMKHPQLEEATVQNMLVGGDNSARAIPIGIILGAEQGLPPAMEHYLPQLRAYSSGKLRAQLDDWQHSPNSP